MVDGNLGLRWWWWGAGGEKKKRGLKEAGTFWAPKGLLFATNGRSTSRRQPARKATGTKGKTRGAGGEAGRGGLLRGTGVMRVRRAVDRGDGGEWVAGSKKDSEQPPTTHKREPACPNS